ncbi:MAG: GAF domain-containing protein [Cyanobacteria bacterium P01_F01_bin.86]
MPTKFQLFSQQPTAKAVSQASRAEDQDDGSNDTTQSVTSDSPSYPEQPMTYRDLFATASQFPGSESGKTKLHRWHCLQWFYNLSVGHKQLTGLFASKIISVLALVSFGTLLIAVKGHDQLLNQARSELSASLLVSDDMITDKVSVPRDILLIFENGYSAIYQYRKDSSFVLLNSLDAGNNPNIEEAVPNVTLNRQTLLQKAVSEPDQIVSQRGQVADRTYTLAAKVVQNPDSDVATILVRGTSETLLNQLIVSSLQLQLLIALMALTIDVFMAKLLGQSIVQPLKNLQRSARSFSSGNRQARAQILAHDEVGQVARVFNQLANSITHSESVLQQQAQHDRQALAGISLMTDLTTRIRQSLDEQTILTTVVNGLREALTVDRVLVYRFHHDYKAGDIVAESVGDHWPKAMGTTIIDPLTTEALERYTAGRITLMEDREQADISLCHCAILENLKVKANLVAPLFEENRLIGLICAHQCDQPRKWQPAEINLMQQIAAQSNYALSQSHSLQRQQLATVRGQQLTRVISQMRQSFNEVQIHRAAVNGIRQALNTDRAVVCWFDPTWRGIFLIESVESGWPKVLGCDIYEPWVTDQDIAQYQQGKVIAIANVAKAGLTDHHLQQLAPYQVQAHLVAPIVVEGHLAGLLITHQCSGPRNWDSFDIDFFKQVASQLGFALEQARLFAQTQALSEERLARQQVLQTQLIQMLSDVEAVAQGDLTVRADVSLSELGTVADFFNAIVENLRQIVMQVKDSAQQVAVSIGNNEGAVQTLADNALRQAQEVTHTLASLDQMSQSIRQVVDNAQHAAIVANNTASRTETSGQAMDLTVQSISNLRQIIGETSKKVKRLGESSQQIAKAVFLIENIATQTRVLAINAGIEAASAGPESQGFVAVAEEVNELAARAASATKDIEQLVGTIQQETAEVMEAMERSTEEVVSGTYMVRDAKYNLERILAVSQQINQLVQSVFEATTSQAEVSENLTRLMQDIAQVSERTAESSYQITESIQQTVAVTHSLQELVGTFKTNESS